MAEVILFSAVGGFLAVVLLIVLVWPMPGPKSKPEQSVSGLLDPEAVKQRLQEDLAKFEEQMPRLLADKAAEAPPKAPKAKYSGSAAALNSWVSSSIAGSRPGMPAEEVEMADVKFSWADETARAEAVDREANRPVVARLVLDSGIALPKLREYLLELGRLYDALSAGRSCYWPDTNPEGMWGYKHDHYELTGSSGGHAKMQAIMGILRGQGFAVHYRPTECIGVDTIHRQLILPWTERQPTSNFVQCIGDASALAAEAVPAGGHTADA